MGLLAAVGDGELMQRPPYAGYISVWVLGYAVELLAFNGIREVVRVLDSAVIDRIRTARGILSRALVVKSVDVLVRFLPRDLHLGELVLRDGGQSDATAGFLPFVREISFFEALAEAYLLTGLL